jgi:hypothetical protein
VAEKRVSKLSNELIFFVPELEFTPSLVLALRTGGTKQIVVENVRDFRTPCGTHMIITTLSVTRHRPQTWDLREYVAQRVSSAGFPLAIDDIIAPVRGKSYRV